MDNRDRDINGLGSSIMDAVNDAVNSGDYSGLNEALKNATGAAAGTAADALNSLKDHLQGSGNGTAASGAGACGGKTGSPQGQRTYGHAGYSSGNMTEEYMRRASGSRHHTVYTSKISPFLQRRVSRNSGTGSIVGGIVSLVAAGFSLIGAVSAGFVGAVFAEIPLFGIFASLASGMGIFGLIVALGLGILGGILIRDGNERQRLVQEYYKYGRIAGTAEYLEIEKLAHAAGESREAVLKNLEKMIQGEMLPAAWFDRQKTTLMLSERIYNEYLQLERDRQRHEEEEARARMQQASGRGDAPASATDDLPDDLKPRPEDAKLPADARKIVEEGLLYIGRIRDFNMRISDEEISAQLAHLELTMKRIIEQVRKDPSSAVSLRRLMIYYLPTTMKLLDAYGELDRQPIEGENIASTKQEIREALETINTAFENLLDSLFQDMAWDISSDISVMKTMMAQDGLTGDGIRQTSSGGNHTFSGTGSSDSGEEAAAASQAGQAESFTEEFQEESEGGSAVMAAGEEEGKGITLTF